MNAVHHTNSSKEPSWTGRLLLLFARCYLIGFLLYPLFFYEFRQKFAAVAAAMFCNSLLTLLFYRADKSAAQSGAERFPEKILHLWELTGGWPGALIAQRCFHHKNRKFSFLVVFFLMIVLHILLLWGTNYIGICLQNGINGSIL